MSALRVVSVCAGIGGFDLGFERAGMSTAAVVEIDGACRGVLGQRFAAASQFADMLAENALPACDVLAGGTPCQGFSFGGLRGGLADDRSNLCLRFCQLANELGPTVIIWENVDGVLSMADNAFGCFLAGLVGADAPLVPPRAIDRWRVTKDGADAFSWPDAGLAIGPRRAAAWRVLNAQYFGVPQRRNRVFVVAGATAEVCAEILFEQGGVRGDSAEGGEARQDVAGTLGGSSQSGGFRTTDLDNSGAFIPIQEVGKRTGVSTSAKSCGIGIGEDGDPMFTLQSGAQHGVAIGPIPFDTTQITSAANGCNPQAGDPCHPLSAAAHPPAIVGALTPGAHPGSYNGQDAHTRHLIPIAFRAAGQDGFAPGPVAPPVASTDGGGAGVPVVFKPSHFTRDKDGAPSVITPPLSADAGPASDMRPCVVTAATITAGFAKHHGRTAGNNCAVDNVLSGSAGVRRLTPIECERLQGFPEDWTNPPGFPQADSPRYKQLGNAVNVACAEWIGRRVVKALREAR